ncbi:hypothetical protein [Desulfocurvus sp.]|uniref:rolling circle replication-associated protein n=1 Tax=Desulfocurvus sp. TaxID=2871698 RepID=UPI0025C4B88D|nr:hypothetical protein [Desulfocurvus sp.]MCK9240379.1 hypothetical protein [Desulfocurvus sp.]
MAGSTTSSPSHRLTIQGGNIIVADLGTLRGKRNTTGTSPKPKSKSKGSTPTTMPEFSPRSRNAYIKALNGLKRGAMPEVVVTLTYTDKVSPNPEVWKSDLDHLRRRLNHNFPKSWWFWRIEPHKDTGRPHYHILGNLMDGTSPSEFWSWLDPTWCRIIKVARKDAPYVTLVQPFDGDMDKMTRYFSKEEPQHVYKGYIGSWARLTNRWGKMLSKNIPEADRDVFEVGEDTHREIKELIVGSIQTQLKAMEDDFAKMGPLSSRKKAYVLEESIKAKKHYLWQVQRSNFYWSVLERDHIELMHKMLEGKRKAGTL